MFVVVLFRQGRISQVQDSSSSHCCRRIGCIAKAPGCSKAYKTLGRLTKHG